ncbi:unnamed protein product, partial [Cercopithifilaria johnstoni]
LITAYHSGRSDDYVPTEAPSEKPFVTAKITTKKEDIYPDYPVTDAYDGPLDATYRIPDMKGEPFEQLITAYHSGRSDDYVPTEAPSEKPFVTAKITTKKEDIYPDYPLTEAYDGPIDATYRIPDMKDEPFEQLITAYHSGRSDEFVPIEERKPSEAFADATQALGDAGSHDRMLATDDGKPLVSPSAPAYNDSEYRIYRPLEPLILRSTSEQKATGFDVSITSRSASGRPLPIDIAHSVPVVPEMPRIMRRDDISRATHSEIVSEPYDFDYHRKTREVDYWIGRHSERQSKPCHNLNADIGIDLASDASWDELNVFESSPLESASIRQSVRDFTVRPGKIRARKVSPTANLHWTTVSETTSVSYKKRIYIERRRPRPASPSHFATSRRQYRPPPPPPEVSSYAHHDRGIFMSSTLPRTFAGVAIEGDLRMQRVRYEASSLPSTYYSSTETRIERNPIRYDLPRPSSPPRYEYWIGERNKWTVEGSPKHLSVTDQNGYDDQYVRHTKQEALHYQKSNLEEIPIISLINDLPMIEDGADECSCVTVLPAPRIETKDLTPGEHSRPTRSAPLRRARQRLRNLCTML